MSHTKEILKYIDANGAVKTPITKIDGYGGVTVNRLTDSSGLYELDEVQIGCPITEMYIDGNVNIGGEGTVTSIGIQGNSGIEVSNTPVTTSGIINLNLINQLKSLVEHSDQGILVQTSSVGDYQSRTLEAGKGISITNPDGVAGNPIISFSGQTGGVTSVNIQSTNYGLDVVGSPITSSGTIQLYLNSHLSNLALNWQQGFLVQTSAGGTFEARTLQAGNGISIDYPNGVYGNPVISATGGGGGGNHLDLIGHITASGNLDSAIYASLANEIPYAYDRMYFNWAIHSGTIPTVLGPINTLPDTGTRTEYRQTIQTGVNSSGIYRAWDVKYSLDYSGTTNGKYSLDYTYINNLSELVTANAFSVEMLDNGYPVGMKSLFTIFGNLDMQSNFITNVAWPIVNTDAANKAYVDSQVGLNYPQDGTLFLDGFGNWSPAINYPGNPNFVLRGNGGWGPPINLPGDPNLFYNGLGDWVSSTNSWVTNEHLNFPELNIYWDYNDPYVTPTITHRIQDIYGNNPLFMERFITGDTASQTQRGWQWKYFLGDEPYQNQAHAILEYVHDQQALQIQPIDVQILNLTNSTPDISVIFNGNVNSNGHRIFGLPATPLTYTDAVSRQYADTSIINPSRIYGYTGDVNVFLRGDGTWAAPAATPVSLPLNLSTSSTTDGISIINYNSNSTATGYNVYKQSTGQGIKFGLNIATSEGYVWADTNFSLKFATDNFLRMKINTNGSIDCFSNNISTSGIINATTGTLKGNNLSAHSSTSITVLNALGMNNNRVTGLGGGVNSDEAVNKGQLDSVNTSLTNSINSVNTSLNNKTSWFSQQASDFTYFYTGIGIGNYFIRSGSYGYLNSGGGVGTSSGSNLYSLDCSYRVKASEFNAYSSIQKKNILSSDKKSIQQEVIDIFKSIPMFKYEYKDKIVEGNAISYGVIAESLHQLLPDYVDMSCYDFVPNIMSAGTVKKIKEGIYRLSIDTKNNISVFGNKLKIITPVKNIIVNILKIRKNVLTISADEKEDKWEDIFVYGTYEKCPTVSKQKLFELSMVITQNLLERVEKIERQFIKR
jgi:hypothetical protein